MTTRVPARWRDPHAGFRDAADAEPLIELRHDTPATAVGQHASAAWATTADGDTITAPVLIGADSLTILAENGYYLLGYPMPPDGSPLRRLGWAWYDATRNDLLRRTGSVRDHVVRHSLSAVDIPRAPMTNSLSRRPAPGPRPGWSVTPPMSPLR